MDHEAVGSVSSPPPRKYTMCGEKEERAGQNERKVNKNLGEITVPRGKLRLISGNSHLASLFLPRFFPSGAPRSSTIPTFPSVWLFARWVLYSTRCRATKRVLLLRAVTTYRPRKRGSRQIVTYFTFFPKGSTISFVRLRGHRRSFSSPSLPFPPRRSVSFYPILFSPRRVAGF